MMMSPTSDRDESFPRCALYDVRFLGLSDDVFLAKKLANVQSLGNRVDVVAVTVVHASHAASVSRLFHFIPDFSPHYMGEAVITSFSSLIVCLPMPLCSMLCLSMGVCLASLGTMVCAIACFSLFVLMPVTGKKGCS